MQHVIHPPFCSRDLLSEYRFGQWREIAALDSQDPYISMQYPAGFHGLIRVVELGPVQLAELVYPPPAGRRDAADVGRHDPQAVQVHLVLLGAAVPDLGRGRYQAAAGAMRADGSRRPHAGRAWSADRVIRQLTLSVPRRALPVPPRWTECFLGNCPAEAGAGAILAELLQDAFSALDQGLDPHSQESVQLGNAALCLVCALIAHRADAQAALPAERRQHVLVEQIRAFIEAHLADPALSPRTVADAHHLSLRHLHRVFQQDGTSVSTWVRQRRLEHCRQDLADPRLATRPIHAIGARWGFPRPADFTRAFHNAYAMPPSEYRNAALNAGHGTVRQSHGTDC